MGMLAADAIGRLREAVESLQAVGSERDPTRSGDTAWQTVCRHCLRGWVEAVDRDLRVATSALRSAARASSWDVRLRRFEEAIWRLVSARDRLTSIAGLSLGTPVLKKHGKGVRFEPGGKKLRRRIGDLARASDAAAKMATLWTSIEDHEAVDLRNTVTHKVPSVDSIPPLVVLEDVFCVAGRPVAYDHPYLVGRKIGSNLDSTTLLAEGRRVASDLLVLLAQAADALADVVAEKGVLHPPRVCVYECKPGLRDCVLQSFE